MSADTLIIGVGNRYRGDDAIGCMIADELKTKCLINTKVIDHDGEPASLIYLWQGYTSVILIDAVSSGAPTGVIHYIDLCEQALPDRFRNYSTHAFGIAEAVELARILNKLPPKIIFYGVEGKNFFINGKLSQALQKISKALLQKILDEIKKEKTTA